MTAESVGRAGGCEWFSDGTRIQHTRCQDCMWGQCPGGVHDWADQDDIDHALATGQPDPSGQKCGCVCADGPLLGDLEFEPDGEDVSDSLSECPICGSSGACGYDNEGRALIHALGVEDEP